MLTGVSGRYALTGTILMGGQSYTETISSSLPPGKYLLKIYWI